MSHIEWLTTPDVSEPVVIAAFEGWNDAGEAATSAVTYLRDRYEAELVALIDPEDFFDFSQVRPMVRLVDGVTREIEWPSIEVWAAKLDVGPDLLFITGHEPHLRWKTFCEQILDVVEQTNARLMLTLGSLLAEVSHARPVSVIGSAYAQDVIEDLDLERSNYEGPTGIIGVLHTACGSQGVPSASLWAAVPTYVPGAPSPKASLALVHRTALLLRISVPTPDLEISAAAYERQVTELVEADDDMRSYVEAIEDNDGFDDDDDEFDERPDPIQPDQLPTTESLMAEVEKFLRDQG